MSKFSKKEVKAVSAALRDMSAAPCGMSAAPRDMLAAPCNMLATQDTHGTSRGLEGPLGGLLYIKKNLWSKIA